MARSLDGKSFSDYTLKALEALGPHVPWEREFLTTRRDCYEHLKLPAAAAAQRDLARYLKNASSRLNLDEAEDK